MNARREELNFAYRHKKDYYLKIIRRKERIDQLPSVLIAIVMIFLAAFLLG